MGKNNVRQIAVDFSCEFKHLQSSEWAGQEPKHTVIHGKLGAKLASGVGLVYFASADRMERSILCGGLIMTIGLFFSSADKAEVCPLFPLTSTWQSYTHPTFPWSPTSGTCAHWGQCCLQTCSLLLGGV